MKSFFNKLISNNSSLLISKTQYSKYILDYHYIFKLSKYFVFMAFNLRDFLVNLRYSFYMGNELLPPAEHIRLSGLASKCVQRGRESAYYVHEPSVNAYEQAIIQLRNQGYDVKGSVRQLENYLARLKREKKNPKKPATTLKIAPVSSVKTIKPS